MLENNVNSMQESRLPPPELMMPSQGRRDGESPHKIPIGPSTVYIGDLPKDVTQVQLYEYLKTQVGGDFDIVLKR